LATAVADNPLLAEDIDRLDEAGFDTELVRDGDQVGVVVRGVALPEGRWSQESTDVMLMTTVLYPQSAMDMFWTLPNLLLPSGAEPTASNLEMQFGRPWRRFSWHRNGEWRPGRDDLLSHFEFARARLNDGR
jgi:Prokaryotic E2 family E